MGALIEKLFKEHKFMRRVTMFWCMWLITHITLNNPDMDTGNFTAVIGLMSLIVGLYQWDKGRDSGN